MRKRTLVIKNNASSLGAAGHAVEIWAQQSLRLTACMPRDSRCSFTATGFCQLTLCETVGAQSWRRGITRFTNPMNDTSPEIERLVEVRYQRMTPDERMKIASSMFETARAIVEASIPMTLSYCERRLAFVRRMYGDELSEAAMQAYADWHR